MKTLVVIFVGFVSFVGFAPRALALPAFALRENVSCTMCHTNGSAPHLTPYGYMYRRAGFRKPETIGNADEDAKHMNLIQHLSGGVMLDYEWAKSAPPGGDSAMTANQVNLPEVEVWPLIGGYLGNFGVWSELDATPNTSGGGGVELTQADLRYVKGTPDLFFNFRGGLMAPEGFGASDQWFSDGGIPLMDRLAAALNQNTLATPFGAMEQPQLGVELGANYHDSHLTLGVFNGFTGVSGTLTPAQTNQPKGLSKDYKLQLDQFVSDIGAVTLAYYNGFIPLLDPTGAFQWGDHYHSERAYLTWFALPGTLDALAGGSLSTSQFVTASPAPAGTFDSQGLFLGALCYATPHLSLGARVDFDRLNTTNDNHARGYSLQANFPYEYNQFVLAFDHVYSDLASGTTTAGSSDSLALTWRLIL